MVDESELRELVEQWRAKQEWHREQAIKGGSPEHSGDWKTFKECADELEELVADE